MCEVYVNWTPNKERERKRMKEREIEKYKVYV